MSNPGISKASPTFTAAHGEFHAQSHAAASDTNPSCVGQVDTGDGPRGPKNPHGLSLDRSIGYFPHESDVVQEVLGQNGQTMLNDHPSLDDLLRMIAANRLHHMPQKGSNWDRSTRTLESFALKVAGYASRYATVVSNAQLTATMIYGRCYTLLRQGMGLVPALGILANMSHTLSLFISCPLQPMSSQLQQVLAQMLDDVLGVLDDMNSYFQDLSQGFGTASGLGYRLNRSLQGFELRADQLLNEIWTHQMPSDMGESTVNFQQIRDLLQPQDEVVRSTQRVLLAERGLRNEFTCEWFSKPFLDFVRGSDNSLWIDGSIGCGKSVLCGWILETLQGPVGGQEYAVVSYAINSLLPSETSTICVLKSLLRQFLGQQYGSRNMCKALTTLMSTITTGNGLNQVGVTAGNGPNQVEIALWECFQIAIDDAVQPTLLVIDGLSEIEGGDSAAAALFQNLLGVIASNRLVGLLVLSRPFIFPPDTHLRRKTIDGRDVHKDIRRVINDLVPSHSPLPSAEISQRIDHETNGNFLWSLLTLQYCAANNFSPQVWRTLPASLDATVALILSRIDLSDQLNCQILFSSIVAMRPLRLTELEILSRLDVKHKMLMPQVSDVQRGIEQACGSFLVLQEGIVLFRHTLLRQALLDTLHFESLSLSPEMHADMANRLLLYLKLTLRQHSELTLKSLPSLVDLLHAHPLLHYALRYWTSHFAASPMYDKGRFNSNTDYGLVLPDTVNAAIVEASFWTQHPSYESLQSLAVSASARKEILGNCESTLQTVACLAEAMRCAQDYTGAANHFYTAFEIAQEALPKFHPFTATCMSRFLDVIDLTDKTTDHQLQKTTILGYMISKYDTQFGPSSDLALQYSCSLADHYASLQENSLSTEMYQKISRLTIDRYGKESSQAKLIAEKMGTAIHCQSEGGSPLNDSVYEDMLQSYHVTDGRRIKASMAKAEAFQSLDDQFNAELIYITLFQGIAEACHLQKMVETHEKLLEIGLTYSKFLRDHGRLSDAQTVLLGLWSQQQATGYSSGPTNILLEGVAMEMRLCRLADMALDVLNYILGRPETLNTDCTCKMISDISLDLLHNAQSHSPPSEAAFSCIRNMSPTDVSVVNALIGRFMSGNRFDEVIAIATETLRRVWPSVLDDSDGPNPSSGSLNDPALAQLVTNLAEAYTRTNQMEAVGPLYWHLFHAARQSEAIDDSTVTDYADRALVAYEQTGQLFRTISLREALLDYCVSRYGEEQSVDKRYALASLYSQDNEKAKVQYVRILTTLQRPGFHEFTALPALKRLIGIYSGENAWDQAVETYRKLWSTFLAKGTEFGFKSSDAKALYGGYIAAIKKRDPVDANVPHEITEQYRSACGIWYGQRHPYTIEAVLLLAERWESEALAPGSTEAIRLYEYLVDEQDDASPYEVVDASGDCPDIEAIVGLAESRLTDFYAAALNADSMRGKTLSRAVRLQEKRYQREQAQRGSFNRTTLSSLTTWISMLKLQDPELALRELHHSIDLVLRSDAPPSSLYNAAVVLAASFSSNEFVDEGLTTVHQLTEKVVFKEGDRDQHTKRSNLVFLTAFEAHLTGSRVDFAGTHARVLMESVLWEHYKRSSQEGTDLGLMLASGAKLENFLIEHKSLDRGALVDKDLFERFMSDYGAAFAQGTPTVRDFYLVLLQELRSAGLQVEIPDIACAALSKNVAGLIEDGHYQSTLDLVLPGFEFIRFVGALSNGNDSNVEICLGLGLMLACEDVAQASLATKMLNLSKTILQETLWNCREQNFNFSIVDINLISRVSSVLGVQQNYEDLEVKYPMFTSSLTS